jgi:signal transduction histidine kinase/CheY-like chemotaxis protein
MELLDALVGLTARLASTFRLDEVADAVVRESLELGFGAVWLAVLDERTGMLSTLKSVIDGVDATHEFPVVSSRDLRLPAGRGFRERRMVNITDPGSLRVVDHDSDRIPPNELALPRVAYGRLRGRPFASGPLLGSRGEPVGALGLSAYRGMQPIPDAVLTQGSVRVFTDHLGLALERALRVAQLSDGLREAQETITTSAPIKAVGQLTASVAHDLNNLSGVALLAVEVGLRSPADAFKVMPSIDRANRASRALVASLQRIARPPSGEIETSQLSGIIDDILTMLRPILRERSIEVETELAAVPPVRCDEVMIHRVVLNLLVNAQDALAEVPADRRRIRLRLGYTDGMVRLIVSDSGPGIAPDVLGRLFQPFSTSRGGAHLGVGLASSRTALQEFGGQIEAHNAATGGAVFEVSLVAATAATEPSPPRRQPIATTDTTGRGRILAVDDDIDVVNIIQEYLNPLGYEVATATDPARALDVASSQGFDLVLCDIGMPGHSGLDMPRALRERGYGGKLILMTGWDSHALSTDPRLAECDTLLKKPFRGAELLDAISALLSHGGG